MSNLATWGELRCIAIWLIVQRVRRLADPNYPVDTDLFIGGPEARETSKCSRMHSLVEKGRFGWLRMEDVDACFQIVVPIYTSIRAEGFKTERELERDGAPGIHICIDSDGGGAPRAIASGLAELATGSTTNSEGAA